MITYFESMSFRDAIDLPVSVDALTLTVGAGSFAFGGEDLALAEDAEHVVTPLAEPLWVDVYLVKVVETGAVAVLVDEYIQEELPYRVGSGGIYELLHLIVTMKVPASAASLDEADITVRKIVIDDRGEEA